MEKKLNNLFNRTIKTECIELLYNKTFILKHTAYPFIISDVFSFLWFFLFFLFSLFKRDEEAFLVIMCARVCQCLQFAQFHQASINVARKFISNYLKRWNIYICYHAGNCWFYGNFFYIFYVWLQGAYNNVIQYEKSWNFL